MKPFTDKEDAIIRKLVEEAVAAGKPRSWMKKAVVALPDRTRGSLSQRKMVLFPKVVVKEPLSNYRIELENGRRLVTTAGSLVEALEVLHPGLRKLVVHVIRQ